MAKRQEIEALVQQLEAANPTPNALADPACVAGEWEVLFSTIKITVRGPGCARIAETRGIDRELGLTSAGLGGRWWPSCEGLRMLYQMA